MKPEPETSADDGKKRLSFDVPTELWNELQRLASDLSIAEGKVVSVSEIARRHISDALKVVS